MYRFDDTIVATCSASGMAARGIVRISGPAARDALSGMFEPNEPENTQAPTDSRVFDGRILLTLDGRRCPVPCSVYYWPVGHGFTGEAAIELHLPGSPPILNAAVRALCDSGRVRMAEAGEFTLRAFLNGRVDLTQAEAVLGVIDATGAHELTAALRQLAGGIGRPLTDLRSRLLDALCDWEAGLDFSDEDIEFIALEKMVSYIENARRTIDDILERMARREQTTVARRVVLLGKPNAGKSALYNRMLERRAVSAGALVSPRAGTTRDYLETTVVLDGLPVTLVDTAGLETDDAVGNDTARAKAREATEYARSDAGLVLLCIDAVRLKNGLLTDMENRLARDAKTLCVATRTDLVREDDSCYARFPVPAIATSARTGRGIDLLFAEMVKRLCQHRDDAEIVPSTALRCRWSLEEARGSLDNALDLCRNAGDETVIASELRCALDQIGLVTGEVHTDEILDRIFGRFCIGK